jgi:hypothetical protein
VGQAPGAGGVCLFAVIVAGCGAGCQCIRIACDCRGCRAAHQLLNVPRLMQGRARQRVEQRHEQKHDVERQGGDGAAQHGDANHTQVRPAIERVSMDGVEMTANSRCAVYEGWPRILETDTLCPGGFSHSLPPCAVERLKYTGVTDGSWVLI